MGTTPILPGQTAPKFGITLRNAEALKQLGAATSKTTPALTYNGTNPDEAYRLDSKGFENSRLQLADSKMTEAMQQAGGDINSLPPAVREQFKSNIVAFTNAQTPSKEKADGFKTAMAKLPKAPGQPTMIGGAEVLQAEELEDIA